ncbi:hypothetical protein NDU88_001315 [Pleurodeles waltl]|uniref:Uncharacterized protein n=1 Tax=Pleurodeles waltl TaxID=8319 RepID=A0AAV7MN30_PLEWA|nr:hypothetical protein NDU88_001315 [Pleurodeles waltl]
MHIATTPTHNSQPPLHLLTTISIATAEFPKTSALNIAFPSPCLEPRAWTPRRLQLEDAGLCGMQEAARTVGLAGKWIDSRDRRVVSGGALTQGIPLLGPAAQRYNLISRRHCDIISALHFRERSCV